MRSVSVGDFNINKKSSCLIISEIGNNHNGSVERAKKLALLSKEAGANCVKFQMRNLDELYVNYGNSSDFSQDLGTQYTLNLLRKFNLSKCDLFEVFDYCREIGILPLCTPWDLKSLDDLEEYGLSAYKLSSADLTNHVLIKKMIETKKTMIVSTGMSTEEEIRSTVELLEEKKAQYVLLHCNSTYPAPSKDIQLGFMSQLGEMGSGIFGYSGHERGIHIPIAAIALGAKVIEKHFTIDRSLEGNDHKVSLLPEEFKEMVQNIRDTEKALSFSGERLMSQGEMINRENLSKSIVTIKDIKRGEVFSLENLSVKSPGQGIAPYHLEDILGKTAVRDLESESLLFESDYTFIDKQNKKFSFQRSWGIPVRYHDIDKLTQETNASLVELHMSYKDLSLEPEDFINKSQMERMNFLVHAPELFENDMLLDITTPQESYRLKSIENLQRVIDLTDNLMQFFPQTQKPLVVTNVGGFSTKEPLCEKEIKLRYELLENSLSRIDEKRVEIVAQTMPPFPWHFGGQQFHNLFLNPDRIVSFCKKNNFRVCLDVSHSKLACNNFNWNWDEFLLKTAPYVAHLHISDALGLDGEGLQIGEGDIDFSRLAEILNQKSPCSSFIPEVWQGHINDGEGFWIALNKLNNML